MWSYVHDTATLCAVLAALSVSGGLFQTLLSAEVRKETRKEGEKEGMALSFALS